MTLGERLLAIRKEQNPKMTQEDFAQTIGVSRSAYSVYEIDRVVPTEAVLKLICMKYGVNYFWLVNGEGKMRIPIETDDELVDSIMTGSSSFQKSVLKAMARMGDEGWKMLESLIDEIEAQRKKDG